MKRFRNNKRDSKSFDSNWKILSFTILIMMFLELAVQFFLLVFNDYVMTIEFFVLTK